jgi:hypothetical protein
MGVDNLATMTLAPPGTPLWHPQKDDFAPRLGLAWQPLPNLVLRAGAGIFYDLGYSEVANGTSAFPFAQSHTVLNTSFPLSAAVAAPAPFTTTPPVSYLVVVDPNHVLPRTYEWNAAVERTLGKADVVTATYLGAAGRKLMRQDLYNAPNPEFSGEFEFIRNDADSSYQALQLQYRHRLAHGLQTLLSYTWAHRSTMLLPTRITSMCRQAIRLPIVLRPTTTSGTRSQGHSPITFQPRATESGRPYLEIGRRIRSFTLDPRLR